jgi:hypothetical protein
MPSTSASTNEVPLRLSLSTAFSRATSTCQVVLVDESEDVDLGDTWWPVMSSQSSAALVPTAPDTTVPLLPAAFPAAEVLGGGGPTMEEALSVAAEGGLRS